MTDIGTFPAAIPPDVDAASYRRGFEAGHRSASQDVAALRAALGGLQRAQREYRWLVHPREAGVCRLCGATDGQEHSPERECGALYVADQAAEAVLFAQSEPVP